MLPQWPCPAWGSTVLRAITTALCYFCTMVLLLVWDVLLGQNKKFKLQEGD